MLRPVCWYCIKRDLFLSQSSTLCCGTV